jgi:hypothetical protein
VGFGLRKLFFGRMYGLWASNPDLYRIPFGRPAKFTLIPTKFLIQGI